MFRIDDIGPIAQLKKLHFLHIHTNLITYLYIPLREVVSIHLGILVQYDVLSYRIYDKCQYPKIGK